MDERLLRMIERHEGRRNTPYRCPAGRLTIGVGHNMDANPLNREMQAFLDNHGYINDGDIDQLLIEDVGNAYIEAAEALGASYWVQLDAVRQFALVDLAFNLGGAGLRKFKVFLDAVRQRDWERAAMALRDSKYYRQLGGDPAGTDDGILERPEEIIEIIHTGRLVYE